MFLQCQGHSLTEYWRLRRIAKKVRAGIVPKGVTKETVYEALKLTKSRHGAEMFGLLSAVAHRADGTLKRDYGLVSVKEVTSGFAKRLVDALLTSGGAPGIDDFKCHKMGSGSTSETDTQTALIVGIEGMQTGTGGAACTHGATSQIYRSVGTLTATTTWGIREHGLFDASTGGLMLDRSVVTNIDLNTDDVVTWTYELTVSAGG